MPETELDFDAYYKVDEYQGIAWYLVSYAKEYTEEWIEEVGTQSMPDEIYHPSEEIEDRTRVVAVMVGDDRKFTFDIDQLTKIEEDEFCNECGQIGCKANG